MAGRRKRDDGLGPGDIWFVIIVTFRGRCPEKSNQSVTVFHRPQGRRNARQRKTRHQSISTRQGMHCPPLRARTNASSHARSALLAPSQIGSLGEGLHSRTTALPEYLYAPHRAVDSCPPHAVPHVYVRTISTTERAWICVALGANIAQAVLAKSDCRDWSRGGLDRVAPRLAFQAPWALRSRAFDER